MAKAKATAQKIKVNFGKRKTGRAAKAKKFQPKKYKGQGKSTLKGNFIPELTPLLAIEIMWPII